jgi:hypothetical protein
MPNEHGYTLPALPRAAIQKELQGPTPWSNWVVRNRARRAPPLQPGA